MSKRTQPVERSAKRIERRAICVDCDGSCGDECALSSDDWVESDVPDVERYLSEHGYSVGGE